MRQKDKRGHRPSQRTPSCKAAYKSTLSHSKVHSAIFCYDHTSLNLICVDTEQKIVHEDIRYLSIGLGGGGSSSGSWHLLAFLVTCL